MIKTKRISAPSLASKKIVMLDTNIWRYLADHGGFEKVLFEARTNGILLAVTPGTISEIREFKDDILRKSILKLATHHELHRLLPEAYSEAEEFKAEIRRLRPQWLRKNPAMKEVNRLRYSWTRVKGGFWEHAHLDIAPPVTDESMRGASEMNAARKEATDLRDIVKENFKQGDGELPLTEIYYYPPDGSEAPVEYWRASGCYFWNSELMIYTSPYREWIDSEVDHIDLLWDSQSFKKFWYDEARAENMKRQWVRGAFEFMQRWSKVTSGTPGDAMLSSHLVEVDYVFSADKNFVRFAERCRSEARFTTAKGIRIAAGAEAADDICEAIRSIGDEQKVKLDGSSTEKNIA